MMRILCLDGIGTTGRVDGSILAHCADRLAATQTPAPVR